MQTVLGRLYYADGTRQAVLGRLYQTVLGRLYQTVLGRLWRGLQHDCANRPFPGTLPTRLRTRA